MIRRLEQLPQWLDCVVLIGLGTLIRLPRLGSVSLWSDELFTALWSRLDLAFIFGAGAHIETIPPEYYLLMRGWMDVFGNSPDAIRLPSVIFSSLAIGVVYASANILFDRKTACIAGLFAAVNPFMVMYAQEARPYALLEFLCGLCFLSMAFYLQRRGGARGYLALFTVAAIAGIYIQYTGLFFVCSCFLTIGLALLLERPRRVREVLLWVGTGVIVAGFAIFPALLAASLSGSPDIDWIPPVSAQSLHDFFWSVLIDPRVGYYRLGGWLAAALILIMTLCGARMKLCWNQLLLLVIMPAAYTAIIILVSFNSAILIPRIAIWLTIPLCIAFARAATAQKSPWGQSFVTACILFCWLIPLQHYFRLPWKENWKAAADIVATAPQCSGPVVFGMIYGVGLVYYRPELLKRQLFATPVWASGHGLIPVAAGNSAGEVLEEKVIDAPIVPASQIPALMRQYRHLAVVLPFDWYDILNSFRPPVMQATLGGGVHVACY